MADFWNSSFWRDLNEGDINFRDNLQFELKSHFPLKSISEKIVFKQEIYMFIPDTLQINRQTYPQEFFFMDQTNLIRYQTPVLSLEKLVDQHNHRSPLFHLKNLMGKNVIDKPAIIEELQLFASIFRSAVRKQVRTLVINLQNKRLGSCEAETKALLKEIKNVTDHFEFFKDEFKEKIKDKELNDILKMIDEYFLDTIEYYLTGYLDRIKVFAEEEKGAQEAIAQTLIPLSQYRDATLKSSNEPEIAHESILHRLSLLNKFVKEPLKLKTDRIALQERYGQAIGSLAAGVAMFAYMGLFALALFAWKTPTVVFTSFPIILIAVVLYILKDRLKEGLKLICKRQAYRWFPDYTTKIENPQGVSIGMIKEYFSFIDEKDLPKNFHEIRNKEFHEVLPILKRHESIMEYKREVQLYFHEHKKESRRNDLITIFRFNVHRFVEKANDSQQTYLKLEGENLSHEFLPKVYHLNIIIRNIYQNKKVEIDKFRVVISKTGIKRVEKI